jgi:hypothetical protein
MNDKKDTDCSYFFNDLMILALIIWGFILTAPIIKTNRDDIKVLKTRIEKLEQKIEIHTNGETE